VGTIDVDIGRLAAIFKAVNNGAVVRLAGKPLSF